jgi:hypothetical protein
MPERLSRVFMMRAVFAARDMLDGRAIFRIFCCDALIRWLRFGRTVFDLPVAGGNRGESP